MAGGKRPEIELEATIVEIAPGGDGVALAEVGGERRAVFVRGTAVGDRVRLRVDLSTRPARGRVEALRMGSDDRVDPPCPHATVCGGCDWMHLGAEAQARAHAAHVRAALPAEWRELVAVEVHPCGPALAYRTRARLHARASGGRAVVGIHEVGTHAPVEVDACAVLTPALEAGRRRVPRLLEGAHGRGDVQLAVGARGLPVLELRWEGSLAPTTYARLEAEITGGQLAGARVWALDPKGGARRRVEATRPAIFGDPVPWMVGADGQPLRLAPGGFAQASEAGNTTLVQRVAAWAERLLPHEEGARRIVELYAGAGNLTVALAPLAADLVAIESSREACEAARHNLAARGLGRRARVTEGDASAWEPSGSTRLLVLDPPRTGARAVAERLGAQRGPRAVLYVSCDPQTLGRDLALLAPRYRPEAVEVFELFPQTSHVETVVALVRRS